MGPETSHLTRAYIDLEHLAHNMSLLGALAGDVPMWPAVKANAYGHGAEIIARHLATLGYRRMCVAHVGEAIALLDAGVEATFVVLSATLPENSEYFVAYGLEPVVCRLDMVQALAAAAAKAGQRVSVHVKIDTGMGRIGIRPEEVVEFLDHCQSLAPIHVKGIMSHFPRADEPDKAFSLGQIARFRRVREATRSRGIAFYHLANSAGIFDLPDSHFDAVRPGISIYGLKPSHTMSNPRVDELKPVLEWRTRITYLKEVPPGTGLSYGHTFHARKPSLIATVPVGYGDGLSRLVSNKLSVLVGGERCPLVGNVTMDQSLLDVTAIRGRVEVGDDVAIIGKQGQEQVAADDLAAAMGTINYEITTAIAARVPRIAVIRPAIE